MTDSIQIWPPGYRLTDQAGAVMSGAQVRFFEPGTDTPKEVFADEGLSVSLGTTVYTRSDGLPVANEGSSSTVTVYIGSGLYKFDVLDADDVEVVPAKDNVKGAIDTSDFLTPASVSTFSLPMLARTTSLNPVTTTHKGKAFKCNASGGNFTMTLDSAVTLGDGWLCYIYNGGTSGQVMVSSSQAMTFAGGSVTNLALEPGQGVLISCDGATFTILLNTPGGLQSRNPSVLTIVDRVSAAPVGATPGSRYIVTGTFSGFAVGTVIEANGVDFTGYVPPNDCGWLGYVQDEDRYYAYIGTAWRLGLEPSASDTVEGLQRNATQAEMETGTSVLLNITPGRLKYHPLSCKAWVNFNGSGTPAVTQGSGVSSITDNGTGDFTANLSTAFADSNYAVLGTARNSGAGTETIVTLSGTKTSSAVRIETVATTTGSNADPTEVNLAFFGDLP